MSSSTANGDGLIATHGPPGTVRLEDNRPAAGMKIICQPRPTEDPNDPLNWTKKRKYLNFALICGYVIMVSEFIDAAPPTWGPMQDELGYSDEILNDSYAAGSAALAVGSLLLIPFTYKFGRRLPYLFSTIVQLGISIWSAKMQTVADLILINVFQCLFGSLAEVIVQMSICDLFFVHQRGRMNTIYIWLWKMTAPLGVIIAGYIATSQGWRWVWWWNILFIGILVFVVAFFYEETSYVPAIDGVGMDSTSEAQQSQLAGDKLDTDPDKTLSGAHSDEIQTTNSYQAIEEGKQKDLYAVRINHNIPMKPYKERLALITTTSSTGGLHMYTRHIYQPLILLTTIPAVAWTAVVYGVLIALQDVMSVVLSTHIKEPPYNFNAHQVGLMSVSKIVGITVGAAIGGPLSDWIIVYLSRRNQGIYEPEFRLWSIVPFVVCIPAGTLLFGIGLSRGLPWPYVAVGLGLYSGAVTPISSITVTYLSDSYKDVRTTLQQSWSCHCTQTNPVTTDHWRCHRRRNYHP